MSVAMASVDTESQQHAESSYRLMKDGDPPGIQARLGVAAAEPSMEGSMCLLGGAPENPPPDSKLVTPLPDSELITSASVIESADLLTSLPTSPPLPVSPKGILRNNTKVFENSTAFSEFNFQAAAGNEPPPPPPPPRVGNQKRVSIQAEPSEVFTSLSVDGSSEHSTAAHSLNGAGFLPDPNRRRSNASTVSSSSSGIGGGGGGGDDDDSFLLQPAASDSRSYRHNKPHPLAHRHKLKKLRSQLSLGELAANEKELKANLFFHIGNPIKRWRVERVVPIKLLLQLLKTFCLVVQICLFVNAIPNQRSDFFFNTREIFEDLFIKQFDPEDPRAIYNAYSIPQVLDEFEYVCGHYFEIPHIAIGGYSHQLDNETGAPLPIQFNLEQYAKAELDVSNSRYQLNGTIVEVNFNVSEGENVTQRFTEEADDPLFHRFVAVNIYFQIFNIRVIHPTRAECFRFDLTLRFSNHEHTGKVTYFLQETHNMLRCNDTTTLHDKSLETAKGFLTVLDAIVLCLCGISFYLTANTLRRAAKLAKAMGTFYDKQLNIALGWWERRSLFSFWHLIIFCSDILIVAGTLYKIVLDYNVVVQTGATRVLLASAALFQAGVILRYLSYFKELNALTRTLNLAFPELGKFLLCAGILFLAFVLAGWTVLSPYHPKFLTFNGSFETLFSLLNGDDIYSTFELIEPEDDIIAYNYSRVLLYTFVALFIYAVLNLFTSLVISAYEASQEKDTAYNNEVRRFIFSGPLTPNGVALRDVTLTKKYVDPEVIMRRRRPRSSLEEEESYELDN